MLYFDNLIRHCLLSFDGCGPKHDVDGVTNDQRKWIDDTLERLPSVRVSYFEENKCLKAAIEKISEIDSNNETFFSLAFIFYPEDFQYGDIFFDNIRNGLVEEKISVAIQANLDAGLSYEEIKEVLSLEVNPPGESSIPAIIRSKDIEIEKLKAANDVKSFFARNPYASVAEAAKTLHLRNKDIRKIINQAEADGEIIKYSNVLRTIEYETLKKRIIEIKMEDPMLSDQDLAEQFSMPLNIIRSAIQESVRIMKMENSQNFAFMAHQSAKVYKTVEEEAYIRHKATKNSSSEWLKIMISARTAIVELYGLKEPERLNIGHIDLELSKEEKDELVAAWHATDAIDIDYKLIEIKEEENERV